jgi:hypothetical protein
MNIFDLSTDFGESFTFPKERGRSLLSVSAAGHETLSTRTRSWVIPGLVAPALGATGTSVPWQLSMLLPFLQKNSSKIKNLRNPIQKDSCIASSASFAMGKLSLRKSKKIRGHAQHKGGGNTFP